MMPAADEIKELKTHYDINLYSTVRTEQKADETYINDTFDVPEIKEPHQIYRSGIGDRIVNAPAEHIITSNPQVFFLPRKPTKASQDSALKLSELVNGHWLPILQRQNPNIFKEFIKDLLGRGEAYFRVSHNKGKLPVNFSVPDAMVIYGSPEEDIEGVPDKVIVWYAISQYKDLIPKYPFLKEANLKEDEKVNWLEYYDSKKRYVEVAETPITKAGEGFGVQENVYGFTPFVRKYSGFGRRSPDGELASLIVSDLRRSRDLIREECAIRSNIASIEYLFAHRTHTFIGRGLPSEAEIREGFSQGAYDINRLEVPDLNQIKIDRLDITPSPETYAHHASIVNELNQRHPFILAGFPLGSSGRQQDMTELSAMRRYDSVVENCENAFATAIGMALKICLLPDLKPDGVTEIDLKTEFDIEVRLKAKDPIEEDRKVTMGERLWNGGKGSISLSRHHTQYLGMTADESKREIARILADQITIFNPEVAAVMGMVAAEETGMEEWLEKARMRRQQIEGKGMREEIPPSGEQRVQGEVKTPEGSEESVTRGARGSPAGFERGS